MSRNISQLVTLALSFCAAACSTDLPRDGLAELDLQLADAGSGEKLCSQSNAETPANPRKCRGDSGLPPSILPYQWGKLVSR